MAIEVLQTETCAAPQKVLYKPSNVTIEDGVFMIQKLIQCKDCKWFGKIGCAINIVDDSDKPNEDDFCSFAERKKTNGEGNAQESDF